MHTKTKTKYVYTDGHTSTNEHVKVEVISNVYPFYGEAMCEAKPTLNIVLQYWVEENTEQ